MRPRLVEEALKQPLLQVALDFVDLEEALRVAQRVVEAGAHIVEIGTPLVKSRGVEALEKIKAIAKRNMVVADLKTVDATKLEFSPYLSRGVDGVTILGIVDDDVVEEAVKICDEANVALIADLMYIADPVNRALRLADIGVDIVSLHVGVDVQKKRGVTARELLKEVSEIASSKVIVMVAGGIKPSEAAMFASHGARIIVIGSAITKSQDPYSATATALNSLKQVSGPFI
uniref:D-arabino 3-hexulose 6-phosphate aldehyde lyase n=1 Tax=Ignisphaera aggregans TaxID=334771 RepID=A0A7C2ZM18_9CREN